MTAQAALETAQNLFHDWADAHFPAADESEPQWASLIKLISDLLKDRDGVIGKPRIDT